MNISTVAQILPLIEGVKYPVCFPLGSVGFIDPGKPHVLVTELLQSYCIRFICRDVVANNYSYFHFTRELLAQDLPKGMLTDKINDMMEQL